MHTRNLLLYSVSCVVAAQAISYTPTVESVKRTISGLLRRDGGSGKCPAVWSTISTDLTTTFLGSDGLCTDMARAAIRYGFHDAGTFSLKLPFFPPAAGGADGSLMLVPEEITRGENGALGPYNDFLTNLWTTKYASQGVGAADLIYFAAAHAIVTCPKGPVVKAVVGRKDSTVSSPQGVMPPGFGPGSDHDSLFQLFQDKGFSAVDLAALVGAHTTSKAFVHTPQVPVGGAQDSTPGTWDVNFYQETYTPPAGVYRFDSDIALSDPKKAVGKEFQGFVNNQGKWTGKFADAMFRLSVLGIPAADQAKFIDCTSALPKGTKKRDVKAAPINDRAR
jgi:manganese peroxidase